MENKKSGKKAEADHTRGVPEGSHMTEQKQRFGGANPGETPIVKHIQEDQARTKNPPSRLK